VTDRVVVWLSGPVRTELDDLAAAASPRETGGLLIGWWERDVIVVRHAIEVPDGRATRTSWARRPRAAKRILRDTLADLEHPLLGYVGDWHSHPEACEASTTDIRSLTGTSEQYKQPLVLLVHLPDRRIDVRVARAGRLHGHRTTTVDPRISPEPHATSGRFRHTGDRQGSDR
jgi:integrative and conjugative element protein (TIGR02256 family)